MSVTGANAAEIVRRQCLARTKLAAFFNSLSGASEANDALHPFIPSAQVPIPPILRQGLDHVFAVEFVKDPEVIVGLRRIGFEGDGPFMLLLRLVQSIQTGIDHPQIQMGLCIFWSIPDYFQKFSFGFRQQPLTPVDEGQVVMGIDQIRLDCNGLLKGGSRRVQVVSRRYDLRAVAERLSRRTRVVFLASPDNPNGTYFSETELRTFL